MHLLVQGKCEAALGWMLMIESSPELPVIEGMALMGVGGAASLTEPSSEPLSMSSAGSSASLSFSILHPSDRYCLMLEAQPLGPFPGHLRPARGSVQPFTPMRRIETHLELAQILETGRGYVLNDRGVSSRKLHHASCAWLQSMVPKQYPKYFSESPEAARAWLNKTFGSDKWENSSTCAGLDRPVD
jgi:hypothetical protein